MRILAIDPGYDRCGVAILERISGKEVLLFSECIETNRKDELPERLYTIGERILSFIHEFKPEQLAIEKLFFNNNQKTAMGVAEARGMLHFIAKQQGLSVHEYTPAQVKVAVTGSGTADKQQVMFMIGKLVHLEKKVLRDDEFDAIGVGITHLAHVR